MRCVGKEVRLSKIPTTIRGGHKEADKSTQFLEAGNWITIICKKCGDEMYVKKIFINKFGTEHRSCKACRKHGKALAINAALAVEERRKKMKLRY